MSTPINYYQGDLLNGTFSLRVTDPFTGKQTPWPIPTGAIVTVRFPGVSSAVVLSSATLVAAEFGGGQEVTVDNAPNAECSFLLTPTKGINVSLSPLVSKVPSPQAFDIVITDALGSQLQTFEVPGGAGSTTGLTVVARAVP